MEMTAEKDAILEEILRVDLASDIVCLLAEQRNLSAEEALKLYYESDLARMIDTNTGGVLYDTAEYLIDLMFDIE